MDKTTTSKCDKLLILKGKTGIRFVSPTGKRPLGRPRRRWEDNIRMYLGEIGIHAGNWVDSAQDRNYWRFCTIICIIFTSLCKNLVKLT